MKFGAVIVVLLKIPGFWDVPLCLDEWFLVFRRIIGPSEHLQLLPH